MGRGKLIESLVQKFTQGFGMLHLIELLNAFFVFDFGVARPIHFHDGKWALIPRGEIFNAFNNKNNLNPLSSPALFDFSGFLRTGVGDPLQAQLSLRFTF